MSLLKKIKQLKNFEDKKNFYEFYFFTTQIGYIHKFIASKILFKSSKLILLNQKIYLLEKNKMKINFILKDIYNIFLSEKVLYKLSGELFPCYEDFIKKEIFSLDRAAVEFLGIRGYGVHLIAYKKFKSKTKIWIPTRSRKKKIAPGKLDNTVAGGVGSGEKIHEAIEREALEEANINRKTLKNAIQVGSINYDWRNGPYTLRRDTLFMFDLEVDDNFVPSNLDGEVGNFKLMDWKEVYYLIKNTNRFKKNCGLVLISFFLRHGLINSKNEKEYEILTRNLN